MARLRRWRWGAIFLQRRMLVASGFVLLQPCDHRRNVAILPKLRPDRPPTEAREA